MDELVTYKARQHAGAGPGYCDGFVKYAQKAKSWVFNHIFRKKPSGPAAESQLDRRLVRTYAELVGNYDKLASEYAERFCDELEGKPFDRNLLQRFAEAIPGGTVCDLGCGPGHVAAYLKSLGVNAMGVDLSPQMIAEAKRRYPSIDFQVGDMLDLKMEVGSLGGIVALYSIIHLKRSMMQKFFGEMHRVLRADGLLLVSFHRGRGELHEDGVLGTQVSFDCTLFEPDEVGFAMEEAGFSIAETTIRRPYEIEYPTQRVYILADKGAS